MTTQHAIRSDTLEVSKTVYAVGRSIRGEPEPYNPWPRYLEMNRIWHETHDCGGYPLPTAIEPPAPRILAAIGCAHCRRGYHKACGGNRRARGHWGHNIPCECAAVNHGAA